MEQPLEGENLRRFEDYSIRLGDEMRGCRATMGKSLLDIERDLKIRAALINAIEQADIDSFEAKWVIPGHVRTYSKYLGMDPEDGYRRFCKESGFVPRPGSVLNSSAKRRTGSGPLSGKGLNRAKRDVGKSGRSHGLAIRIPVFDKQFIQTLSSAALICSLIAGIGYVGWTAYGEISSVRQIPAAELAAAEVETDSNLFGAAASETSGGFGFNVTGNITGLRQNKTMGEIRPGEFGQYSEPVTTPVPDVEVASVVKVPPEIQPAAEVETVDPNQVVLVPSRAAWIRVSKTDGTVIKEGTLAVGNDYIVPQNVGSLRLRAGNSGSLYFVVGGEIYGPAGRGTSVAKNVDLAAVEIRNRFERIAVDQVPQELINVGWNSQVRE